MISSKIVIYSLLGLLLGITGTVLYKKIATPSDDPYYFLEPKSQWGRFAETEIKLYQQGDSVDVIFWKVPIMLGRPLIFFAAEQPELYLRLSVKQDENINLPFYPYDIFTWNGPVGNIINIPMFEIKIYKINNDLSQTLLSKTIHIKEGPDRDDAFLLAGLNKYEYINGNYQDVYPYGQYRVNVKVLGNWPELKIEGLKYYMGINTASYK